MIDIYLTRPNALDRNDWRTLQAVQHEAISHAMDRSQAEVDALLACDEPEAYYQSHIDPNYNVGGRYYANQDFFKPRVAVAVDKDRFVGFAYAANNVSGATKRERLIKRFTVAHNYLWLREFAVLPDYQNHGIARFFGRKLLKDANPSQPVTAYPWPDEEPLAQGILERHGFKATRDGEQEVLAFGEGSAPVRQVRMLAPTVRSVLKTL